MVFVPTFVPGLIADQRVISDVPCRHCGYNLRTLDIENRCPECGLGVHESVVAFCRRELESPLARPLRRIPRWVVLSLFLGVCSCLVIFGPQWLATGRIFPKSIIEKLESPVAVSAWTRHGLVLGDGRLVSLVGIDELPETSRALAEATRHGVEVGPDGAVIALVRIHHWCGNDPVRKHLARVDIAELLRFYGEDGRIREQVDIDECPSSDSDFGQYGWNISAYLGYQWRE